MKNFYLYAIILIALFQNAFSQGQTSDDIKWFGTIYIRPDLDARDFSNETHPYFITMQRVAFGFEKQIYPNITVFVEAMDNRIWGQPQNPRKSIANLDLHQGYLKFVNPFDLPINLQIGRFEKEFNKKVLGPSNWQDVPRAFDGFDVQFKFAEGFDMDVFYFINSFPTSYFTSAIPANYPYPAPADKGVYAYGLTSKYDISKKSYIQPIAMLEVQGKGNPTTYDKLTTAIDYINKEGNLDLWLHAGYHNGSSTTNNTERKLSAWGGHLFLGYDLGGIKPMLIVDINSGTKTEDIGNKDNLYVNNFSNGHIFWGIADYFTNMSVGTANRGLNQFAARFTYNEKEPFSAYVEGMYFMTNTPYKLTNGTETNAIGTEIDLVFKYNFNKKMYIDWGTAFVLPGDVWKELYSTSTAKREDLALYSYIRFMFNF